MGTWLGLVFQCGYRQRERWGFEQPDVVSILQALRVLQPALQRFSLS